jgi:uncharacterized protein (TIGR02722 family)
MNRQLQFLFFGVLFGFSLYACGPKAFTKGQYSDPEEVILLDDKFNENDMQLMANTMVNSLIEYEQIKNAADRPIIMVGRVRNRTSEHVDMKALTDKIRTALIRSGKFTFSDKDAREELAEEYEYQGSGFVDSQTAKGRGSQVAVDFIITGDLSSNVQQVGRDKVVYYKLNVNLVDVSKNLIAWADEREVRKKYRKRNISN